jgi:splicing factor 3B subunit 1
MDCWSCPLNASCAPRQVREAYWKVYNNLYIGSQDAMIPAFPLLEDDVVAENNYRRVELEYVL